MRIIDEYFNSVFEKNFYNYFLSVDYQVEIKENISLNYYKLISDLLGIIRYKTNIDILNFPYIKLIKENDTYISLTIDGIKTLRTAWK